MAVTSRDLHSSGKLRQQAVHPAPAPRAYPVHSSPARLPYVLTVFLCVVALVLVANSLITWGRVKMDDLRYGRPRTMHLSGVVGHEDSSGSPTQFVAMNLNRRVVVFEIPGGDVAKTRTLTGPYLFGADEDLTPVRLQLALVNDDPNTDLVVSVKDEDIIYINENGSYRLINDGERAAYEGTRSVEE
jgi:hypothetical protein